MSDRQVVVGSIVRAHGVRGEVVVYVTTDDPDERYAAGSVLATDPAAAGPLTIEAVRSHTAGGRPQLLVTFAGVADRDAAERLRGTKLLVTIDETAPTGDADEFFDFQLVGLAVELAGGERIGEIARVGHGPGADMLVVSRPGGRETLIPFVRAIVPTVDVPGGRIVITPPEGLLEL